MDEEVEGFRVVAQSLVQLGVKFWHEGSVYSLGGVGYKFRLSLGW